MIITIIAIITYTKYVDRNSPWSFDETRFAKHLAKQEGRLACFTVFQRGQRAVEGTEGRIGDRGPYWGQRAIEGTEGCRGDRGS